MSGSAVVVGGGLAGLAASVRLSSRGVHVTMVEQSDTPGGRCYSYPDIVTQDVVDNGQHVLLSAYTETLRYLDQIGTSEYLDRNVFSSLVLQDATTGFMEFSLKKYHPCIPVPAGLVSSPLLEKADKLKLLRMGFDWMQWTPRHRRRLRAMTIDQWLDRYTQSQYSRTHFWHPLAIAVMNELPAKACAYPFVHALKLAFYDSTADQAVLVPSIGQTELYVTKALEYIARRGAEIRIKSEVTTISASEGKVQSVVLKSGETLAAPSVVLAVPQYAASRLFPAQLDSVEPYCSIGSMEASPIISVHLWFEKSFMDRPMIGLVNRRTQWLFDRISIVGYTGKPSTRWGGYVSATISAGYDMVDLHKEAVVASVLDDIHTLYSSRETGLLRHSQVIKEKRATFSNTPAAEAIRPGTITPIAGLYLAGDWTDTGLPPTIEGAIRSGFAAADAILLAPKP